ncbi:hypothetical protein CLV44_12411 [Marinobacterium halophilum]|uniref:Uncharacterized protein n=1 Tax=Marinobacterium halophilum TaxID=267374 RepID=A0A2P8END7_9GAMM|nr:hypothetical protein CLV44_12411 [Marinobacterium halophilum]
MCIRMSLLPTPNQSVECDSCYASALHAFRYARPLKEFYMSEKLMQQ